MRDNNFKDNEKPFKHDDPPHSRLFIAHTKQVSEEELRDAFGKYGTLEDVYLCRDNSTGEQKDIAFVKFSKTSDAARALEDLNGKSLEGHNRPLKVSLALARDQPNSGAVKGDDMEKLLRLFIAVPKSMTEDEITKEFQEFGDLDYVSVLRDRETKESKGYAFVKFTKPSHAAIAFEECNRSFKAVFARPKEQDQQRRAGNQSGDTFNRSNYGGGMSMQFGSYPSQQSSQPPLSTFNRSYNAPDRNQVSGRLDSVRLSADVSSELSDVQLKRLFDLMPGFVSLMVVNDRRYLYDAPPRTEVYVEYNSLGAANYALEKLNGFEYPIGKRIYLSSCDGIDGIISGKRDSMGLPTAPGLTQELASITKALAEATKMIKLQVGGVLGGGGMNAGGNSTSVMCTARLPPPQQLARKDSKMAERLFVMGTPSLPMNSALWDVFGRFGDLIEVYIINGKNCGFVNYAKKESADKAFETLNGEEVNNMKLRVTYADPPKHDSRKRLKMDTDA